jgi:hypothetical protein
LLICYGCDGLPLKDSSAAAGDRTFGLRERFSFFTLLSSSNAVKKRSVLFLARVERVKKWSEIFFAYS